jgi:hypothetical protein
LLNINIPQNNINTNTNNLEINKKNKNNILNNNLSNNNNIENTVLNINKKIDNESNAKKKLRLSVCEAIFSVCARGALKKKINIIEKAHEKLENKIDLISIMKALNELELIKMILFEKEQLDIISSCNVYRPNIVSVN